MSVEIPARPDNVRLVRALKGAPLSCLMGLACCYPHPVGGKVLEMITGYQQTTVYKALDLLVGVYQLVERTGRFEAYVLSGRGREMVPGAFSTNYPQIEHENFTLDPRSSSGLISLSYAIDSKTTTTTSECENFTLPPRAQEILEEWFDGCPRPLAVRALRTALERGDPEARIEYRAIAWSLYTQCPLGTSIRARAIFVARKIEQDARCPDIFQTLDDLWRYNHRAELRRLDELGAELERLGD